MMTDTGTPTALVVAIDVDPAACAGTIFGSQQALPINANLYRLAPLIGNFLTGNTVKQHQQADRNHEAT